MNITNPIKSLSMIWAIYDDKDALHNGAELAGIGRRSEVFG